jgi:hypothetical protein
MDAKTKGHVELPGSARCYLGWQVGEVGMDPGDRHVFQVGDELARFASGIRPLKEVKGGT